MVSVRLCPRCLVIVCLFLVSQNQVEEVEHNVAPGESKDGSQQGALPIFSLGFCSSATRSGRQLTAADLQQIAVAALAKKMLVGRDPIMPLPGKSRFEINWFFGSNTHGIDELNRQLTLMHEGKVDAVVGCWQSGSSKILAQEGAYTNTVQISMASMSDRLSDKKTYPFFLRTIPEYAVVGTMTVATCTLFKWTHLGMLYETNARGESLYSTIRSKSHHRSVAAGQLHVDGFEVPFQQAKPNIRRGAQIRAAQRACASKHRVFAATFYPATFAEFLDVSANTGLNKKVFICIEINLVYEGMSSKAKDAWHGMMGIDVGQRTENYLWHRVAEAWRSMTIQELPQLGVPDSVVSRIRAEVPDIFKSIAFSNHVAYEFDAIMALAIAYQHGLDNGLRGDAIRGDVLLDEVYNTSFRGASGEVAFVPRDGEHGGNRKVNVFSLWQILNSTIVDLGVVNVVSGWDHYNATRQPLFPDGSSNPRHYDYNTSAKFRLGLCGRFSKTDDFQAVAVAALAKKMIEGSDPALPLRGQSHFKVDWSFGMGERRSDEISKGLALMRWGGVDAIVGCRQSASTEIVAEQGNYTQTVQISMAARGDRLSNREAYPYFLRTVPEYAIVGKLIVTICKLFGWTRVGMIYADDYRGRSLYSSVQNVFRNTDGITVRTSKKDVQFEAAKKAMGSKNRVFVVAFYSTALAKFLGLAIETGLNENLLITMQINAVYARMTPYVKKEWHGMMGIDIKLHDGNPIRRRMTELWRNMTIQELSNLGIPLYFVSKIRAELPDMFESSVFDIYALYEFDAIMALAIAYQRALDNGLHGDAIRGNVLLDEVYNASFQGASGEVAFIPRHGSTGGNRNRGQYVLYQIQNTRLRLLGRIDDNSNPKDFLMNASFPDGGSDPRSYNAVSAVRLWALLCLPFARVFFTIGFVVSAIVGLFILRTPLYVADMRLQEEGIDAAQCDHYSSSFSLSHQPVAKKLVVTIQSPINLLPRRIRSPLIKAGIFRAECTGAHMIDYRAEERNDFRAKARKGGRIELCGARASLDRSANQGVLKMVNSTRLYIAFLAVLALLAGLPIVSLSTLSGMNLFAALVKFVAWCAGGLLIASPLMLVFQRKSRHYARTAMLEAHDEYMKALRPESYLGSDLEDPNHQGVTAGVICGLNTHYRSFILERNMHYIVSNIVIPLTMDRKVAFVTLWGGRTVAHFVSHSWGTPFDHFASAIRAASETLLNKRWHGEVYWICSFSNNQWDLQSALGETIMDSAFARVLTGGIVQDVVMVLDAEVQPLTRVWCLFEVLITRQQQVNFRLATSGGIIGEQGITSVDVVFAIASKIQSLKVAECSASNPQDKADILDLIERDLGSVENMDVIIKKMMARAIMKVGVHIQAESHRVAQQLAAAAPSELQAMQPLFNNLSMKKRWSEEAGLNPFAPLPRAHNSTFTHSMSVPLATEIEMGRFGR